MEKREGKEKWKKVPLNGKVYKLAGTGETKRALTSVKGPAPEERGVVGRIAGGWEEKKGKGGKGMSQEGCRGELVSTIKIGELQVFWFSWKKTPPEVRS